LAAEVADRVTHQPVSASNFHRTAAPVVHKRGSLMTSVDLTISAARNVWLWESSNKEQLEFLYSKVTAVTTDAPRQGAAYISCRDH